MRYSIRHQTAYQYSEPASLSQNELFFHPRETPFQRVLESGLTIEPEPQYLHGRTDYFGNRATVFMVQHSHSELSITAQSVVETIPRTLPSSENTVPWETAVRRTAACEPPNGLDARQFAFASPLVTVGESALAYARPSFAPGTPVLMGAVDLMGRIFTEFKYDKSATTVETSVAQVLETRKGVCTGLLSSGHQLSAVTGAGGTIRKRVS